MAQVRVDYIRITIYFSRFFCNNVGIDCICVWRNDTVGVEVIENAKEIDLLHSTKCRCVVLVRGLSKYYVCFKDSFCREKI